MLRSEFCDCTIGGELTDGRKCNIVKLLYGLLHGVATFVM